MERKFNFCVGEYYHIYTRGVEKRKVFLNRRDYERFTTLLYVANSKARVHISNLSKYSYTDFFKIVRDETLVDVGCYCMMPNHFHLLLKEKEDGGISKFLSKLLTGYSMYFNTKNERSGPLFVKPFRAKHIQDDRYLNYLFAYIHLNPVALYTPNWEVFFYLLKNFDRSLLKEYRYSSYQDFIGKRDESVILNRLQFPEYFATANDFENMINDWITFRLDFGEVSK